ncbi:hypothetical protein [Weissella sagaensis]|uniref:hypothetical protein n=1 Tax=Weissella sagaensis TaxID=2559928 RepID=UPI00214C5BAF|nr:hypothetical protein [Weissella sagaensis]
MHLDDIPLQDNKLYLDRIKADTTGNISEDYTNDSLETIDHNLAADSIKLK